LEEQSGLKLGGVVMLLFDSNKLNVSVILDNFISPQRRMTGDPVIIEFLSDISKEILRSKKCREYPDIITFGYFCRKGSIKKILKVSKSEFIRYGWGIAVHIAPSNVPINFAFSFVFGLLSGNNNLVRLPSNTWPQVDLLVSIFEKISDFSKYKLLRKNNAFIRTERNSPMLHEIIANCDALIVWGGDATVSIFRQLNKKPRCVELYFSDRKSSLVINAHVINDGSKANLDKLALNFFNDTYLVDNNACSSPRRIFWVGDKAGISSASAKFWLAVNGVIESKDYNLDVIAKIDKYLDIMKSVQVAKSEIPVKKISENIWLTSRDSKIVIGRLGRFSELGFTELDLALKALDNDEQTLTYIGFESEHLEKVVIETGVTLDRVVPVGMALDIGFIWDGVDVLQRLSRIVDFR
jgi:hypothetical protein